MHPSISAIHSLVRARVRQGKVVDVDDYCQMFSAEYPELTRQQIEDAVLELVSICGGAAVWGTEKSMKSCTPDDRG